MPSLLLPSYLLEQLIGGQQEQMSKRKILKIVPKINLKMLKTKFKKPKTKQSMEPKNLVSRPSKLLNNMVRQQCKNFKRKWAKLTKKCLPDISRWLRKQLLKPQIWKNKKINFSFKLLSRAFNLFGINTILKTKGTWLRMIVELLCLMLWNRRGKKNCSIMMFLQKFSSNLIKMAMENSIKVRLHRLLTNWYLGVFDKKCKKSI